MLAGKSEINQGIKCQNLLSSSISNPSKDVQKTVFFKINTEVQKNIKKT